MFCIRPFSIFSVLSFAVFAQVVTYEGETFPEEAGWERIAFTEIDRFLADGWFVHFVDETNEVDFYRKSLVDFAGERQFFIEFRAQTDAPSSILDFSGTPAVLSAAGTSAANYHFTLTDTLVRVWRSNFLPIVFVDIEPGVPHTYRLELFDDQLFAWYIDAQLGDSGTPEGPYPNSDSFLIWGVRRQKVDSTTRWDYVRFGVLPADGSGDYDSDGRADLFDYYFFHECLSNHRPGIHGGPGGSACPGCRFADFDADGDVDLHDFARFQNQFDMR